MKRKVRMMVAAVCTIAVAGLFFKPDHVNVYAKSYGVEQVVVSETVVDAGDILMVPTAWETDGMHIYFFSEKGESLKNVTIDKGQNYTIPSYTATMFSTIPDGYKFAGWRVDGKPDDLGNNSWKLLRVLTPVESSENTPVPSAKPTPVETEVPTDTPTPIVTEEPTDMPTPIVTEAPADTPTPIVTEAPISTIAPTPVVTEEPMPTQAPIVTEEPTQTSAPVVTEAPTQTSAPVQTTAPVVTEAPTQTSAPVVTESPSPTPTPVATAEPTITPEPTQTPDVPGEDIDSTVIKSAGAYQLKPMIKYSLQGGISHVEGDITHYANPIEFTVEAGGLFQFY